MTSPFACLPAKCGRLSAPTARAKPPSSSLITGRIPADSGSVNFDGEDITRLPAHARIARGIAYTFQITSIFGELTAEENVSIAVQRRIPKRGPAFQAAVSDALQQVGLTDPANRPCGRPRVWPPAPS